MQKLSRISNEKKGIVSIDFRSHEKISISMAEVFDDRSVLNLIEVKCLGTQSNTVRARKRVHYHEQIFRVGAPWQCAF